MNQATIDDLCLLSRALERAIRSVPDKPRHDVTTDALARGVLDAAQRGIRHEAELAESALRSVGVLPVPQAA